MARAVVTSVVRLYYSAQVLHITDGSRFDIILGLWAWEHSSYLKTSLSLRFPLVANRMQVRGTGCWHYCGLYAHGSQIWRARKSFMGR